MLDTYLKPGAGRVRTLVLAIYPLVLVAIVWQVVSSLGLVRPLFLPTLSVVLTELWQLVQSGELFALLWTSMFRAISGVVLAAVAGIAIGFLCSEYRLLRWVCEPFVAFGFPLPKIALIPVFTVWFGIGDVSKIVLVFATCVFPFIVAAQAGADRIPTKLRWAAQSMGTRNSDMFRHVVLPATLPSLFTGLRIALPIGLITVFTAEMVTGGGLGEAIVLAQRYFQSAQVYALVLVTMLVGYLMDVGIVRAQRRLLSWAEA